MRVVAVANLDCADGIGERMALVVEMLLVVEFVRLLHRNFEGMENVRRLHIASYRK